MRSARNIDLSDLGDRLNKAKQRLSREKQHIIDGDKLSPSIGREEYAFAYMRAERLGLEAIKKRLAEIAWLPMQLDPQSELVSENKEPLTKWIKSGKVAQPGASEFGNDFIHALTRSALKFGWDSTPMTLAMARIGTLFRDFSCLIGLVYYCTWLAEHDVEGVALTDPDDLNRTVVEIAAIVQSPELHKALRERAATVKKLKAKKEAERLEKKKPMLKLISNPAFTDDFAAEPRLI